jgi:hypothetical protein
MTPPFRPDPTTSKPPVLDELTQPRLQSSGTRGPAGREIGDFVNEFSASHPAKRRRPRPFAIVVAVWDCAVMDDEAHVGAEQGSDDARPASERERELASKERDLVERERERAEVGDRNQSTHERAAALHEDAAALHDRMADMDEARGN